MEPKQIAIIAGFYQGALGGGLVGVTWSMASGRKPVKTTIATALIGGLIGSVAAAITYRKVSEQLASAAQRYLAAPLSLVDQIRSILQTA